MSAPVPEPVEGPHVVVVGSGIAGLTVALHARQNGCRVTLVTKDVLEHANTRYAQGGIAGVMFDDDRVEDHIRDTLVAGAGLSDPAAVRVLAEEGPARIRELVALGVDFDRDADGAWVKGLEAAHSYPRILHAGGDATGTAIERALVARMRASGADVVEHAFLVDLAVSGGRVTGVDLLVGEHSAPRSLSERAPRSLSERAPRSLSERAPRSLSERRETKRPAPPPPRRAHRRLTADAVVLATGGAGQLYAHTTNPPVATADGIAAALRAGAAVADLEFFQFHPTVLPQTETSDAFLVSEAVRGEGATLVDDEGRRFAFDDHPDGELAPRDVVARAIARQMHEQGGRPVRLDATGLGADFLARRFPTIDRATRDRGLDWASEPIPVTPAAHYLMGGIVTDLDGRTTVPGLYAVGEAARTGVHGANRLASNSLLEGAVFGARAGDTIAADAASGLWQAPAVRPAPGDSPASVPGPADGDAVPPFRRAALQELMWRDAGLVRDAAGLEHAAATIACWRSALRTPDTEAEYEDENLLLVAAELVRAALQRRESVGAHFRSDSASAPELTRDRTPQIRAAIEPQGPLGLPRPAALRSSGVTEAVCAMPAVSR